MSNNSNISRTFVEEEDLRTLESVGLLEFDGETLHPGDQFETLLPVLRALDDSRPAGAEAQPSDSVGDHPPEVTERTTAELVSLVAHDLRGPLSQASGWLALARADGNEEAFDGAADAHRRLAERVEDFVRLASTEIDPEAVERVSLAEAADTVWAELVDDAMTEGGMLVVEDDRTILVVRDRLERLLANLFRNSLVHGRVDDGSASTGTHGWAGASHETDGGAPQPLTVRVGRLPNGFYVEDDGTGIAPENRDRVFETGYSGDADGSGLGLASVAQVAATHGWEVTLTEGEAGGVRFEFSDVAALV